jgi:PKD repeat protein
VNPGHLHVFGNSDMQVTLPQNEWHYFDIFPTTTGLSVQSVQEIRIYSSVVEVPGGAGIPTSTSTNGKCDDVNGNGVFDFDDVVLYFNQMDWIAVNEPLSAFDFNNDGQSDFNDIVALFNML